MGDLTADDDDDDDDDEVDAKLDCESDGFMGCWGWERTGWWSTAAAEDGLGWGPPTGTERSAPPGERFPSKDEPLLLAAGVWKKASGRSGLLCIDCCEWMRTISLNWLAMEAPSLLRLLLHLDMGAVSSVGAEVRDPHADGRLELR